MRVMLWQWGRHGGGPRYTYELARALKEKPSIETHLSVSRQCELFPDFEGLELPTYAVDTYTSRTSALMNSLKLPKIRSRFSDYINHQDIDVVLCTMSHLWNMAVMPKLVRKRVKQVLVVHDAIPHAGEDDGLRRYWLRKEMGYANGLITLTDYVRGTIEENFPNLEKPSWVIPHGVFDYARGSAMPRQLPQDRPVRLLFFGRILPYKGLDVLLSAYEQLQAKGPPVSLQVVGPGDISPYRDRLQSLPNIHLDNRWIPEGEIPQIFHQADLVVLPYVEATQSGVPAIAMNFALPMVATRVGGLPEQLQHGETGLLVPSQDAHAFAQAITELTSQEGFYHRCSRQALQRAHTTFSWTHLADQILEALHCVRGS